MSMGKLGDFRRKSTSGGGCTVVIAVLYAMMCYMHGVITRNNLLEIPYTVRFRYNAVYLNPH